MKRRSGTVGILLPTSSPESILAAALRNVITIRVEELFIGLRMFIKDGGLVWERTVKITAKEKLILEMTGANDAGTFVKHQLDAE